MLKKTKSTTFQTVTHSVFKMALELEKNRADWFINNGGWQLWVPCTLSYHLVDVI